MTKTLPEDLRLQLEAELAALKRLDGADGVAPDHLRFRAEIAGFQARTRASLRGARPAAPGPGLEPTDPRAPPRLRRDSIRLDLGVLRAMLRELQTIARPPLAADDALSRLAAASDEDPALLEELAEAAAFDDEGGDLRAIEERIGVAAPALAAVGRLLASPFVAEARHDRGDVPETDARHRGSIEAMRCPTCGSAPSLAVLDRDDGRRRLLCSLCGDGWIGPRLMCPFCGSTDPAVLATLRSREEDPRWIETCDACRHYIRTIDHRLLPESHVPVPGAEEAAAAYLDVLAEEAGYARPVW